MNYYFIEFHSVTLPQLKCLKTNLPLITIIVNSFRFSQQLEVFVKKKVTSIIFK